MQNNNSNIKISFALLSVLVVGVVIGFGFSNFQKENEIVPKVQEGDFVTHTIADLFSFSAKSDLIVEDINDDHSYIVVREEKRPDFDEVVISYGDAYSQSPYARVVPGSGDELDRNYKKLGYVTHGENSFTMWDVIEGDSFVGVLVLKGENDKWISVTQRQRNSSARVNLASIRFVEEPDPATVLIGSIFSSVRDVEYQIIDTLDTGKDGRHKDYIVAVKRNNSDIFMKLLLSQECGYGFSIPSQSAQNSAILPCHFYEQEASPSLKDYPVREVAIWPTEELVADNPTIFDVTRVTYIADSLFHNMWISPGTLTFSSLSVNTCEGTQIHHWQVNMETGEVLLTKSDPIVKEECGD